MFGNPYSHRVIRKYVIYFGTIFSDIYIQRRDSNDDITQTMKVPLSYGPKEKFLARLLGTPNLERSVAIQLPRMSFEITNIAYDPSRKINSMGRVIGSGGSSSFQYNPIPYNIDFNLYIMVKNADDGTQIVEQILPYFAPEWTATLNINDDLGQKHDVPIILNGVQQSDTYEGDFITRRAIIWTLSYTIRGWLFGPTREGGVIKRANINLSIPSPNITIEDANSINTDPSERMSVSPGLTANGEAVDYYGASSHKPLSAIDPNLVNEDDDYGFITEFMSDT